MKERKIGISRRKFISGAAAGLATAGLSTVTPQILFAQTPKEVSGNESSKIIKRKLGRTGIEIPIVSMGVMNANNPEVIQASYELGIRHFDTAAYYQYGRNEQMVGSVINKLGVRDKVIIATKVHTRSQRAGLTPAESKAKLLATVDGCLGRLNMDYIDILYVHDVSDPKDIRDQGILDAMAELKDKKKIGFAGVSTHGNMAEVINESVKGKFVDVVLTAINFTLADDSALLGAIQNAADNGVGIIAMKTQAGGGRWPNEETRRNYSSSVIAKAALKWVLRNKNITTAIPGFTNFEHMNEDFSVSANLDYTDEERNFLSDNNIKLSFDFCRQCGKCMASCPEGVEIPALMRTYMYAAQYGNFQQARATIDDIPDGSGLSSCSSCDTCPITCTNRVDIGRRINELKIIYS